MSKEDFVYLPIAIAALGIIIGVLAGLITLSFAPVSWALVFFVAACFASMVAMAVTWP